MSIPQIAATKDAEWKDPITNKTTFVSINAGTTENPDYQWKRKAEFTVVREFSVNDESRIINAEYLAAVAAGKIKTGSLDQMIDNYTATYWLLEDPDEAVDVVYGGPWAQRRDNWFKLEEFGIEIDGDIVKPENPDVPDIPDPEEPKNPIKQPINVGSYGIKIYENDIIFPDDSYYQVQDYAIPHNVLFEGVPESNLTLADGVYKIINLTTGDKTRNVVLPAEETDDPYVDDDGYVEIGSFGFSVNGLKVKFSQTDYYQIQDTTDFSSLWEGNGPYNLTLTEGTYKIIKLTDPVQTIEGLMLPYNDDGGTVVNPPNNGTVTLGTVGIKITENEIVFTKNDYYQIQDAKTFVTVFEGEGNTAITLPDGVYQFINLTLGQKAREIQIPPVDINS